MKYKPNFFKNQCGGSYQSAKVLVPLFIKLINPKNMVDVGCGLGTWASIFVNHGIDDVIGIDGDYVNTSMLYIPKNKFISRNLEKPIKLKRKFDLALSLEVGEHLDIKSAEIFVKSLTELAPVVIFSAAIPFQGGVNHINEQWQSYWQKLFEYNGFVVIDCIRGQVWNNTKVSLWYRQNLLIYINKKELNKYTKLKRVYKSINIYPISIVHPESYLQKNNIKKRVLNLFYNFIPKIH